MKLTPRSMAWLSAAREVLSSVDPQSFPPIPHAPKPIADIFQPVRPKARYSMFSTLSAKIVSLRVVYSNGMAFCKKRGLTPAMSHPEDLGQRFKKTRNQISKAASRSDQVGRTGGLDRLMQEGG